MKIFLVLAMTFAAAEVIQAQERSVDEQITEALMPLPPDLRAGASVIRYDDTGKKILLRRGTSNITCTADSPAKGFSVSCYPNRIEGYRERVAELLTAGTSEDELLEIIDAEVTSGKLRSPDRAVAYSIRGADMRNALPITVVYLPGATADSTALSTTPDHYRPWLMLAGTAAAHIMIPGQ